jgi:hypothetical protein
VGQSDIHRGVILASSGWGKFIESIKRVAKFLLSNPKFLQQALDLFMANHGPLLSGDNRVSLRGRIGWILILWPESGVVIRLSGINEPREILMHKLEKSGESYIRISSDGPSHEDGALMGNSPWTFLFWWEEINTFRWVFTGYGLPFLL